MSPRKGSWLLALLLALSGCAAASGHGQHPAAHQEQGATAGPMPEEPEELKQPPPAALVTTPSFPTVTRETLPNGLSVSHVAQPNLPLSLVMLGFHSGRAQEGDHVGVARLTARLLKLGGAGAHSGPQLIEKLDALGVRLQVSTGSDHVSYTLSVLNEDLGRALELLGTMVAEARTPLAEFLRLRQQEQQRAKARARSDLTWGNHMVLYRELFETPTSVHPYAHFDATATHLGRLELSDCKQWRDQHLTPENAELVVVGRAAPGEVLDSARRAFQTWKQAAAPRPEHASRPSGPERLQIFVVDHADSPLSEVVVGVLGAPRTSAAWPSLSVAVQLLGAGSGSRLYLDLREKRQIALRARADLVPLLAAPAVVELSASAKRDQTVEVVKRLLEHVEQLGKNAPAAQEVESAARTLAASYLNHADPLRALAQVVARERRFGLDPAALDRHHRELLELDAPTVHRVVAPYFNREVAVVAVSADAKRVADPLAALAPVVVIDAEKDFSIKRRVAYSPLGTR